MLLDGFTGLTLRPGFTSSNGKFRCSKVGGPEIGWKSWAWNVWKQKWIRIMFTQSISKKFHVKKYHAFESWMWLDYFWWYVRIVFAKTLGFLSDFSWWCFHFDKSECFSWNSWGLSHRRRVVQQAWTSTCTGYMSSVKPPLASHCLLDDNSWTDRNESYVGSF